MNVGCLYNKQKAYFMNLSSGTKKNNFLTEDKNCAACVRPHTFAMRLTMNLTVYRFWLGGSLDVWLLVTLRVGWVSPSSF